MGGRWLIAAALAVGALASAPSALAQVQPTGTNDFGGFRNVLPAGQGETVNAQELAAFQAGGDRPDSFTDQLPLYTDLLYAAPTLQPADLDRYFKSAGFGPGDDISESVSPRPGVTILRDAQYQVPHVYGATRSDTMFGAGYASAQDRLFLMDVLRHTGRARLTELVGPGDDNVNVRMDAAQLKIADYSEEELQRMIDVAAASAGGEGAQIRQDLLDYVDGVNAYIAEARRDPSKMPVEYAALGKEVEDWKPTDTVAVASLIGGIFGRGGGGEALNGLALREAQERFGVGRTARRVFEDFRSEDDPEAPVTASRRFPFDDPGRRSGRALAVPDLHSFRERNPIVSGVPESEASSRSSQAPSWLQDLRDGGLVFPKEQSNALLVAGEESESGRPVAVMGPQVSYYSPQILLELDLHGPGIDARGAAFPGISLYVLLGRGQDFAWSATTATTDVVDEYAERLCEPDGSQPTIDSDHYLYRGQCRPLLIREHKLTYAPGPVDIADGNTETKEFTLRVERSVHGPIQARATVDGVPVAIAEARSTYFHELESAVAFKRLNGNEVHDARSFQRAMNHVNFAFNWFYADDRDIAFFNSGWYPRRARGVDTDFPAWGTGEWDWKGFDPGTYTSRRMPFRARPKAINPPSGYLVNWNNKQAPGWRAADDQWAYGSVYRSERLEDPMRRELRGDGKLSLTELVQIMQLGATIDPRGQELYPWLRRVIGRNGDPEIAQLLRILDSWQRNGSHRRDLDRDNVYDESAAVALMDAWWPALTRRMFEPVLGTRLVDRFTRINAFDSPPNDGNGSSYGSGWFGYVDKDLRSVLGKRVRNPLSREYCGRGSRSRCRQVLLGSLRDAAREVRESYGVTDLADVRVPATCPEDSGCDQIEFITAGAIGVDPIPWQDRPTFQQVVEVQGHRPR